MQILKSFLLSPLCLTKLFNKVRLNVFKLFYLVLYLTNLLLSFLLIKVIVFGDFMVDLGLVQLLESHELFLMLQTRM